MMSGLGGFRSIGLAWLGVVLLGAWLRAAPPDGERFSRSDGWKPLFNGNDLDGWKPRNPIAAKTWIICSEVRVDPEDPARLLPVGPGGSPSAVLLNGGDGRGSDLMTTEHFDDYELHLEFLVAKGGNSGVYNRGLFEIQIYDSYGVPKPGVHDCGALYERASPPENLARPPGQWQSFDIKLVGKRISLDWNGQTVFRDRDFRYGETDRAGFERLIRENREKPELLRVDLREENGRYLGYFGEGGTRSGLDGPDRPGPILLQGDHGPVAFRNLYIRPLSR
jgi:hypothetical protein